MEDLDEIKPLISMKQLLAVVSKYYSILNFLLIQYRVHNKEICKINLNLNSKISNIDIFIDGVLISKLQVDGGSSVNLMTTDIIENLDFIQLLSTTLILKMTDHSQVKPMGIFCNIDIAIARIIFKIDYIYIFLLQSSILLMDLCANLLMWESMTYRKLSRYTTRLWISS